MRAVPLRPEGVRPRLARFVTLVGLVAVGVLTGCPVYTTSPDPGYGAMSGCGCDTTYGCDGCGCEPVAECLQGVGCDCDPTYGCDFCPCEPVQECLQGGRCICDTTYGCDGCPCEPVQECL